jgi:hypothetical protein
VTADETDTALAAVPWIRPRRTWSWDQTLATAAVVRELPLPLAVRSEIILWMVRRTFHAYPVNTPNRSK